MKNLFKIILPLIGLLIIALVVFRYAGVPVYQVRAVNIQNILKLAISSEATPADWEVFISIPIRQDTELDKIRHECAMLSAEITERQGKLVFSASGRQSLTNLLRQVDLKIEASE